MSELMQVHHYQIDFPLSEIPLAKRRLELMRKVDFLQKTIKKKGFHDARGLKNLVCYAPYTNFATCFVSTEGDEEWLPDTIQEMKKDEETIKTEAGLAKTWIKKTFLPTFKPTPRKLKSEKDWFDSLQLAKGGMEVMTKEAEEKRRVALEQATLNGETGHVVAD